MLLALVSIESLLIIHLLTIEDSSKNHTQFNKSFAHIINSIEMANQNVVHIWQ